MQEAFVGGWTQESHLSAELLGSLRDLNHRFLDLAASRADVWAAADGGLPLRLALQLAPLSTAQRAAAADCPYALFDLRFEDDAHWRMRLEGGGGGWRVTEAPAADDDMVGFVRLALFYAWHVASGAGLKAQLLLGMNAGTAAALRRTTVHQLPSLVASEAPNLSARWSDCSAFWHTLSDAALRADTAALRRVQLYGLQLAAAARFPKS
jgi:hypothetical protein